MSQRVPEQSQRVTAALADPRWSFRTVDGIARESQLAAAEVRRLLDEHPEIARRSAMKGQDGRALYAAPDRRVPLRERLERIRWMLAR